MPPRVHRHSHGFPPVRFPIRPTQPAKESTFRPGGSWFSGTWDWSEHGHLFTDGSGDASLFADQGSAAAGHAEVARHLFGGPVQGALTVRLPDVQGAPRPDR